MTDGIPALDIGDHVTDRDDPDATMLVVGLPLENASDYHLGSDDDGPSIADVNPDYPAEDAVVEVIFAGSADTDVDHAKRYAYPQSRLERVTPIHSDEETEE